MAEAFGSEQQGDEDANVAQHFQMAECGWGCCTGTATWKLRQWVEGRQLKTYQVDKVICESRVLPPKHSHTQDSYMGHAPKPHSGTGFGGRASPGDSAGGKAGGRARQGGWEVFPKGLIGRPGACGGRKHSRVRDLLASPVLLLGEMRHVPWGNRHSRKI